MGIRHLLRGNPFKMIVVSLFMIKQIPRTERTSGSLYIKENNEKHHINQQVGSVCWLIEVIPHYLPFY